MVCFGRKEIKFSSISVSFDLSMRLTFYGQFCRGLLFWLTRMDTTKYGETLKFMYLRYQSILVVKWYMKMFQTKNCGFEIK